MFAVLGIDPGSEPGLALLTVEPSPTPVLTRRFHFPKPPLGQLPSPTELVACLLVDAERAGVQVAKAVIEDQYLDKNPDTLKKLARNAGRWEEACVANGLPVEYLPAVTWQAKELGGGRGKGREQIKRLAVAKAKSLGVDGDEHTADATLISRCAAIMMYYRSGRRPGR